MVDNICLWTPTCIVQENTQDSWSWNRIMGCWTTEMHDLFIIIILKFTSFMFQSYFFVDNICHVTSLQFILFVFGVRVYRLIIVNTTKTKIYYGWIPSFYKVFQQSYTSPLSVETNRWPMSWLWFHLNIIHSPSGRKQAKIISLASLIRLLKICPHIHRISIVNKIIRMHPAPGYCGLCA